jgi:uncharacterized OB-fold protein
VSDEAPPFRLLPRVEDTNEFFWTSGADGRLRFLRCRTCGYYIHPPSPICPIDLSRDLAPEAVSGRGTVLTFTVNHQPWIPGYDPPYVIAIVELEEQEGLRLMTNIVGCGPDDVSIGMAVEVTFEHNNDVWLPLFRPVTP